MEETVHFEPPHIHDPVCGHRVQLDEWARRMPCATCYTLRTLRGVQPPTLAVLSWLREPRSPDDEPVMKEALYVREPVAVESGPALMAWRRIK